jgi:putative ABC transport system permease protein
MFNLLKFVFSDLKRNKIKVGLTSLGIIIGVFAVVTLVALGLGLQIFIEGQFAKIGTNLVIVFPGNFSSEDGGFQDSEGGIGTVSFDLEDVKKLKKIKIAKHVVPTFIKVVEVKGNGKSEKISLIGSSEEVFEVQNGEIQYGVTFSKADVNKGMKVTVLGYTIAEKIFDKAHLAIGKVIRLNDQRFVVKGVLKKKGGGLLGRDFDTFVYTPYTATYVFNPDKTFAAVYTQPFSKEQVSDLKVEVKKTLDKRYDKDDYSVLEQEEILGVLGSIISMLSLAVSGIGSISLLVGGVGIMNVMYAAVTERTKEIGIRRALGATKADVLWQFLIEAITVSVLGGLVGLVLSIGLILIANYWFPARITAMSMILALGVSAIIGIGFGVWPARRAANLPPVEAIRKR